MNGSITSAVMFLFTLKSNKGEPQDLAIDPSRITSSSHHGTQKHPPNRRHGTNPQTPTRPATPPHNPRQDRQSYRPAGESQANLTPKKRSFPPPDELLLARHQSSGTKTSTRPNPPLTTQDKIRMVTAKERAKDGATKLGRPGTSKPATTALKRARSGFRRSRY
ncbi:hypothetical protein KC333_g181 [Hortaea werneckii]|nr:hypothetical protein KC333_g181 [Hortaea werneckii]